MPSKRVSLKGKGADLFFGDYTPPTPPGASPKKTDEASALVPSLPDTSVTPDTEDHSVTEQTDPSPSELTATRPRRTSRKGSIDSVATSNGASDHVSSRAITLASTRDIAPAETIEAIRKVVKVPGREVSFVRLTPEEKARLGDLVYTFKRQGHKTTENEINRIALNYLLHDFQEHGERSVLARVLAALLA